MSLLEDRNAIYLFTAYGVFLGGMISYALFLWLRRRALDRESEALDEIEREQQIHKE
ncbi:MAG: hypothetical protein RMM31_01890 [Anaerolineae bacterium]|nr:hypothetical protein [Thermoflexales bacterium]MDW8394974.1 hypothetical protein [Anaerolineae bacterium]